MGWLTFPPDHTSSDDESNLRVIVIRGMGCHGMSCEHLPRPDTTKPWREAPWHHFVKPYPHTIAASGADCAAQRRLLDTWHGCRALDLGLTPGLPTTLPVDLSCMQAANRVASGHGAGCLSSHAFGRRVQHTSTMAPQRAAAPGSRRLVVQAVSPGWESGTCHSPDQRTGTCC